VRASPGGEGASRLLEDYPPAELERDPLSRRDPALERWIARSIFTSRWLLPRFMSDSLSAWSCCF
jgi:hypothetical protein